MSRVVVRDPVGRGLLAAIGAVCLAVCAAGVARANELGDTDGDCLVNATDLATVLASWGPCPPGDPFGCFLVDLNGDGVINHFDVALLLGNWGHKCTEGRILDCIDVLPTGATHTYTLQDEAPPGGTYAWTIMQPGAQVSAVGPANQSFFTIQADNPSAARDDVTVKCVYTFGTMSATASCVLTAVQLRVTAIKFDYKGPDTDAGDALNIRASKAADLAHEGNGRGAGEWLKPFGAGAPTRTEPCLYIAGVRPKVQAKFEVRPRLPGLFVGAYATGGIFAGLPTEPVNFDVNGVSDDGAGGSFVTFDYAIASPVWVSKGEGTFEWTVSALVGPLPVVAEKTADITGPHTMYHVLETPRSPWYDTANQHPWVNALHFAIDSSRGNANGRTTLTNAISEFTHYIHSRTGGGFALDYDIDGGRSFYAGSLRADFSTASFDLTKFMTKARGARVNCHDVALAVQSLGALMGARMQYLYMGKFGYINPTFLVGRTGNANPPGSPDNNPAGTVNNPFPRGATPHNTGDNADHEGLAHPHQRYPYATHGFCEIMNATVGMERTFDACVGPHLGTQSRAQYVTDGIDRLPAGGAEDMAAAAVGDINVFGRVIIDYNK